MQPIRMNKLVSERIRAFFTPITSSNNETHYRTISDVNQSGVKRSCVFVLGVFENAAGVVKGNPRCSRSSSPTLTLPREGQCH